MANKQKHSNEYYFLLALVGLVVVLVPIVLLRFSQMKVIQRVNKPVAVVSPTGVPAPIITDVDSNTKEVTFPEYKISFQIPKQFIHTTDAYQVYSDSVDISLTSSDAKTDGSGQNLTGIAGLIRLDKTWSGFSNEVLSNKPYWSKFIVDNSIFQGIHNTLISTATARAYKLGRLEVKIDNGFPKGIEFSMTCYDVSSKSKIDDRCPEIEKTILSTLQIIK